MRFARTLTLGASVLAAAVLGAPAAQAATTNGLPDGARTSLVITVQSDFDVAPTTWSLGCAPTRGDHPNKLDACRMLNTTAKDPFAPTRVGVMCNMVFYGPQTAHVVGEWHGQWIDTTFSRENGCANARWQAAKLLLEPLGK